MAIDADFVSPCLTDVDRTGVRNEKVSLDSLMTGLLVVWFWPAGGDDWTPGPPGVPWLQPRLKIRAAAAHAIFDLVMINPFEDYCRL